MARVCAEGLGSSSINTHKRRTIAEAIMTKEATAGPTAWAALLGAGAGAVLLEAAEVLEAGGEPEAGGVPEAGV